MGTHWSAKGENELKNGEDATVAARVPRPFRGLGSDGLYDH
jgi:hypothetical protein